jgi:hypothetical protein
MNVVVRPNALIVRLVASLRMRGSSPSLPDGFGGPVLRRTSASRTVEFALFAIKAPRKRGAGLAALGLPAAQAPASAGAPANLYGSAKNGRCLRRGLGLLGWRPPDHHRPRRSREDLPRKAKVVRLVRRSTLSPRAGPLPGGWSTADGMAGAAQAGAMPARRTAGHRMV